MKLLLIAVPLALFGHAAFAGDVDAGMQKFNAQCEECHFDDDFSGEAEADIAALINNVVNGTTDHKADLSALTADDVANLAAFFASK